MSSPAPLTSRDGGLDHVALLYRDPDGLRTVVGRFVREAVRAHEPILAVLPAASGELLGDLLSGLDAPVTQLRAEEVGRNPGRLIPAVRDWLPDDGAAAHIVSEVMWPGRDEAEVAELLRHEALVNVAFADDALSFLCPYDAEHLPAEVIAGAAMTHPRVCDDDGLRPSEDYGDPVQLARGEHWPQSDPAPPVTELSFDGDLWALRRTLADDELLAGLAPQRREDLVFAVNEAASNAMLHGDGTCRARVWRDGDRVVSEVATGSAIGDPLAGRTRPAPDWTSGRGLWLINQLCDLVEVRTGADGTSVRMHVAVPAGGR